MEAPSRAEIAHQIRLMLRGHLSRTDAAEWAGPYLRTFVEPDDALIWSALTMLGSADMTGFDRPHLYEDLDFLEQLSRLESQEPPERRIILID